MPRRPSNSNHFPLPYGLMPSAMWLGSKTVSSPTHLTQKPCCTKPIMASSHPLPHSAFLVVRPMPIPKRLIILNLVNAPLSAFTLGLLKTKRLTYYIAASVGSYLRHEMLNFKRLRIGNHTC